MPVYSYKGKTIFGKVKRGKVTADNIDMAKNLIRNKGIVYIESVKEEKSSGLNMEINLSFMDRVKLKDIVLFTRQLYSMINAGIPLVSALRALEQQVSNRRLREIIKDVAKQVEEGGRFSAALAKHKDVFGDLYISMIKAAEEAGTLDTTLKRLAEYLEKIEHLRSKVKSAMFYPTFVLIIATIIVSGILIFVIPTFANIYKDLGGQLPTLTQIVINISNFLRDYIGWMIGLLVIFIIAFKQLLKIDKVRYYFDMFMLKIPIFGKLILKSSIANFARTLSSMVSSGINILKALDIAAETSNNKIIQEEIKKVKDQVERGISLAVALSRSKIFPPMLINMVAIGEDAGNLDEMLGKVADFYEEEVDTMVDGLTSLIEPLMMVFIGGVIGFIIIAMYLPIFNIGNLIK
ncbi:MULTISPECIES: type II secretion system F family protein [unclassified Desulfurobacterium]|uniref:type II secretion system F family protein n=1 Tax=Desulfurobacterium sp. TC5-1 TaxID=1158318 RepID=UPI0003B5EBCD|nr:type II secretion system F family protein [Desulfurobacterium sp. TC5-1]